MYLVLSGRFIANNSQINIRSIGQSSDNPNSALQCISDRTDSCCSGHERPREWYLQNRNGTVIKSGIHNSTTTFYQSRGDNGEVFLNRPSNATSPTGQFCCEIADAANRLQTLCVIIGILPTIIACTDRYIGPH